MESECFEYFKNANLKYAVFITSKIISLKTKKFYGFLAILLFRLPTHSLNISNFFQNLLRVPIYTHFLS